MVLLKEKKKTWLFIWETFKLLNSGENDKGQTMRVICYFQLEVIQIFAIFCVACCHEIRFKNIRHK